MERTAETLLPTADEEAFDGMYVAVATSLDHLRRGRDG